MDLLVELGLCGLSITFKHIMNVYPSMHLKGVIIGLLQQLCIITDCAKCLNGLLFGTFIVKSYYCRHSVASKNLRSTFVVKRCASEPPFRVQFCLVWELWLDVSLEFL